MQRSVNTLMIRGDTWGQESAASGRGVRLQCQVRVLVWSEDDDNGDTWGDSAYGRAESGYLEWNRTSATSLLDQI